MSANNKTRDRPRGRETTPYAETFRDEPHQVHDALGVHAPRYYDDNYRRTLLTIYDDVRFAVRDKRS